MKSLSDPALNDRARQLLKTLVERYISEGQPVGSRALSKYSGLDLSAASIRNIMADLEELGLITSPHTSAGRIPTTLGYRLFVDTLLTIQPFAQEAISELKEQLPKDSPGRALSAASQLLSQLTEFAGVVLAPRRQSMPLAQVEFVRLGERRILLILVLSDGDVQNRILLTEQDYDSAALLEANNFLAQNCQGKTLQELREQVYWELCSLRGDITQLMDIALSAGEEVIAQNAQPVVISGESNLLREDAFAQPIDSLRLDSLRRLFQVFEEKTALLQLLDRSQQASGINIFIGSEAGIASLDECSVVSAPYRVDGQLVGTLGVIGPTRMAYSRVISIVDITARLLSSALSSSAAEDR